MKNRVPHIHQILAVFLLWVFALALTPWSSFHHHHEEVICTKDGKVCAHKTHVGNESHNCLICSAHFEKDYYTNDVIYHALLKSTAVLENFRLVSATYVELIATSLRGPPATC
ncbi:hypothetical protein LPB86_02425 [Pedobacter sp. MC2016-14]|uniref:hypothetical protein n=1 Tax=Pedobacter sp. MC2016-14 TaxID=2897327 RepID=UPI001E586444|nr:hypothetical protein [Pedobacter sp. MC2016-14]MCD0487067.1 hypothetical protein [Pedobacter sp. MC2016-14]